MAKLAWTYWDYMDVFKPAKTIGAIVTIYTLGPVAMEAISEGFSMALPKIGDYAKLASQLVCLVTGSNNKYTVT